MGDLPEQPPQEKVFPWKVLILGLLGLSFLLLTPFLYLYWRQTLQTGETKIATSLGIPMVINNIVYLQSGNKEEKQKVVLPHNAIVPYFEAKHRLLTISPSGRFIVYIDITDSSIKIYDRVSGNRQSLPNVSESFFLRSPFADVLIYKSAEQLIEWDLMLGKETRRLTISPGSELAAITGRGDILITRTPSGSYQAVNLTNNQKIKREFTLFAPVFVKPTSGYLVKDNRVFSFSTFPWYREQPTIQGAKGIVTHLSLTPSGKLLALAVKEEGGSRLQTFDLVKKQAQDHGLLPEVLSIQSLQFFDERWLAVIHGDYQTTFIDTSKK